MDHESIIRVVDLVTYYGERRILNRINLEIRAVLEDAEVRQKLVNAGLEVAHGSPEDFAELIRKDYAKYSRIIREAGLKAQ